MGKDFDVVVSNAINVFRPGNGERVWERLDKGHLSCARERAFIIVVTKYGGVGNFTLDKKLSVFKYCLNKGVSTAAGKC